MKKTPSPALSLPDWEFFCERCWLGGPLQLNLNDYPQCWVLFFDSALRCCNASETFVSEPSLVWAGGIIVQARRKFVNRD